MNADTMIWDDWVLMRAKKLKDALLSRRETMAALSPEDKARLGGLKNKNIDYDGILNKLDKDNMAKGSSMRMYINRLANLYRALYDSLPSPDNLHHIKDTETMLDYIKKQDTIARKTSLLSALTSIAKRLGDDYKDAYETYSKAMKEGYQERDKVMGENKMTDKEEKLFNGIDWDTLVNKVRKINSNDGSTSMLDKALLSLYTELPPRRLEYGTLVIKKHKNPTKIKVADDGVNYLLVDNKGEPRRITLNSYKTSKNYGQYNVDLTPYTYLRKALKPLVSAKNDGDYLFTQKNGKVIPTSNFTTLIKDAFVRRVGRPLTVNNLRHLYSSKLWEGNPTVNEAKEVAQNMGHSVLMSMNYKRNNTSSPSSPTK